MGPFHAGMHVLACQLEYGARNVRGTGLTFGDVIEHLWADTRRFALAMAYMSMANRDDLFMRLVRTVAYLAVLPFLCMEALLSMCI